VSIAGPLIAVGLALVFSGLYRAATGAQLLATRQDWALAGLGAAMVIAGVALAAKGL
jgi:predicted phage tail protein